MAGVALWQRLEPFWRKSPLRPWLKACLDGTLSKKHDLARDAVGNQLEVLHKRVKEFGPVQFPIEQDGEHPTLEAAAIPKPKEKTLVEELLQDPALPTENRTLIEMILTGHTQKEIASRLKISQPAINQRLKKIGQKLSSPQI